MSNINIRYPSTESAESGCYRFLELPSELLKVMEDGACSLTVRGRSADDAVLCTDNKTYTIRSVTLSNSFCVITPNRSNEAGDVVIRDNVQEILELAVAVPRLHRLNGLLRESQFDEGLDEDDGWDERESKRTRYTLAEVRAEIQASDEELEKALRDRHILLIKNELRPIAPAYLTSILELLLTTMVSLSQTHDAASAVELADTLENDHEIRREVAMQVMSWFGDLIGTKWRVDIDAVVTQIGLGILRAHQDPLPEDELLRKWRAAVGDMFEAKVTLGRLLGNYLSQSPRLSDGPLITFFPSSNLPISPAERFADLFLTRPRWLGEDLAPFLNDIVVDVKERDKLLMKYTRSTTDAAGLEWYTARGGVVS